TETYHNWQFTSNDGLQNAEFLRESYYYQDPDKIYFGGKKGVNSFNPEQISINNIPPKIVIT
ncbi:MAG: hypothetical protein L3J83_10955, partial [Proteobacteria bacterium]|nr:hypothetical protein [Pseudomonadota bacterium]